VEKNYSRRKKKVGKKCPGVKPALKSLVENNSYFEKMRTAKKKKKRRWVRGKADSIMGEGISVQKM